MSRANSRHLFLAVAALSCFLPVKAGAQSDCSEVVPLQANLEWISSAVWSGASLYVTDPRTDQVIRFGVKGQEIVEDSEPLYVDDLKPMAGISVGGFYVQMVAKLKNPDGSSTSNRERLQLRWYSKGAQKPSAASYMMPPFQEKASSGYEIIHLYDGVAAAARDRLVGFALATDLSTGKDVYGFFEVQANPPERVAADVKRLSLRRDEKWYDFGHPNIAAINNTIFYLELGAFAELYRYNVFSSGGPVFLSGLPYGDEKLPVLPSLDWQYRERLQAVSQSRMPVGLYSSGPDLFLLYRDAKSWELIQMRPRRDDIRVKDRVKLPTTSETEHLTLAPPGPGGRWVIFERSGLDENGKQRILGYRTCRFFGSD